MARRALKTINFREEDEKLNVYVAWLNLESMHGTQVGWPGRDRTGRETGGDEDGDGSGRQTRREVTEDGDGSGRQTRREVTEDGDGSGRQTRRVGTTDETGRVGLGRETGRRRGPNWADRFVCHFNSIGLLLCARHAVTIYVGLHTSVCVLLC